MDSHPLLQATGLAKAFGETLVLKRVDLSMANGQRVALLGPSGSGKSTLLHCLAGLERVDNGEIHFDGVNLGKTDAESMAKLRRERMSSVFQFFHLLPTLSARENVEFPLQLLGLSEPERQERVMGLIEEVQLTYRMDALPETLSGGEMQRVAIARALAPQPKLILADAPTGNLDRETGASILELMRELTDRHAIALLLVTHSDEAAAICHQRWQLRDGVLVGA